MAPLAPLLPADPAASDEHADDDERAGLLAAADGAVGQRRPSPGKELDRKERWRIAGSFFVFGLINNVLYVIILSAALDLVPSTTPKGVVLFFNIAPSLMAKVAWPYLLSGAIHYRRRVLACAACSFVGMLTIAFASSVPPRLLGISLASFSSGLGELTFLQLSSIYPSALSLGGFASGTGGAGLLGAGLWFVLKGLGVTRALGMTSVLPLGMVCMLQLVLRPPAREPEQEDDDEGARAAQGKAGLSAADKWRLARPLIVRFMLPLFAVYVFEYSINQGIAPTLLYDLPTTAPLRWLVKTPRDFYPLYQLTYQLFVFVSRSSHLVGLPALPIRLLSLPSVLQGGIFVLCLHEALRPVLGLGPLLAVVCVEGLCGGTAYVQTFHHVGRVGAEGGEGDGDEGKERRQQEREWRIGVVGASDSWGVLVASLISMPLELALCQAQVDGGRDLCRTL